MNFTKLLSYKMTVDSNRMNRVTRITAAVGMLLLVLVERVISSKNENTENLFDFSENSDTSNLRTTIIVSETDKLKLKDYIKDKSRYIFINNLSSDNNDTESLLHTSDMPVTKNKCFSKCNCMCTCLYTEVEKNKKTKKKIFIVPNDIQKQDILITRFEEIYKQLDCLKENAHVKSAIKLMKSIFDQMICRIYIDYFISGNNTNIKYIKSHITEKNLSNTTAYAVFNRQTTYNEQEDLIKLFTIYNYNKSIIDEIANKYKLAYLIDKYGIEEIENCLIGKYGIEEIEKLFEEKTNTILENIKNINEIHNEKTVNNIVNKFIDNIRILINILTNSRLNFHTYINIEELKTKIEEEEEGEVRNMLIKILNICLFHFNDELTIGIFYNEIEIYKKKLDCMKIYSNPSIAISQKTLVIKANKMFNRILKKRNIKFKIDIETLKKEAKPWNGDLVHFLVDKIISCVKFKGNLEEVRQIIKTVNTEIIEKIKHNECKNMIKMHKLFENGIMKIMKILENKKDNAFVSKIIIIHENEQIIEILADISLEHAISKEQKKKDIRRILSEIAKEFALSDNYSLADALILEKKIMIVNLIFSDSIVITKNKNEIEMKTKIREIVRRIVDVLVDRTIEYTHKFNIIENEIRENVKYIKNQNLDDIFGFVLKLIEKHGYISDFNGHFVIINNQFVLAESIASMKDAISRGYEEIKKWIIHDITWEKACTLFTICSILNEISTNKNILETCDNTIFLNPVFLVPSGLNRYISNRNMAYIYYRSTIDNRVSSKYIKLTDKNLQAFRNVRTIEDIAKII